MSYMKYKFSHKKTLRYNKKYYYNAIAYPEHVYLLWKYSLDRNINSSIGRDQYQVYHYHVKYCICMSTIRQVHDMYWLYR